MRTAMQQFIARLKDGHESCQAATMKVIFKVAIDEAEALLETESQQIRLAYVEGQENVLKKASLFLSLDLGSAGLIFCACPPQHLGNRKSGRNPTGH